MNEQGGKEQKTAEKRTELSKQGSERRERKSDDRKQLT